MEEPIQITDKKLSKIEKQNTTDLATDKEFSFLYPSLDDKHFNLKIAHRKEFYDTRYEKPSGDESIEEISDKLCNADIELAPHQMFVRNFLSFHTPYNGLLLYHGLGSGKTCSAISIAEEMRTYLIQMGISQRIIVVASPNVQENFRLQLFDERKLVLVDGLWNIRACTGNKFLSEINPTNMKGIPKDRVISQIKQIISSAYIFLGYIEFANYIRKKSEVNSEMNEQRKSEIMKQKLMRLFKNRLIIIDEVHNIRMTEDNSNKKVAKELQKLVNNVQHMRLLLLSATPMYNSYKEVIWLLNLLNSNDGRSTINSKDVFNSAGNFITNDDGEEIGKELLIRKATGYVSFVKGENPYTYPFRIWPSEFAPTMTGGKKYPKFQMNGATIVSGMEHLSIFLCKMGVEQQKGYDYIISQLKNDVGKDPSHVMPSFENMDGFGYTVLQRPLEALNIVYPDNRLLDAASEIHPKDLVGKAGLSRILKYKEGSTAPFLRSEFEYKTSDYSSIFLPEEIGKYSGKIDNICKLIKGSSGVILIYSQYIDGGLVPIALALESMGMRRAGNPSLFKTPQADEIDAKTYKTRTEMETGEVFSTASYVMITGDKAFSPDNVADLKKCTNLDNKNGENVKVILISQAGAEGLDFKFIRQVHVLEPWYNMNRIEQIIGRAVRTCSHKDLPFSQRNVQIFLHGSVMVDENVEAADLYVYRLAELKSVQIGIVSRALKESAIDCLLNIDQTKFAVKDMNTSVKQSLSTGETIDYDVGDRPYTSTCDYMKSCSYKCRPDSLGKSKIIFDTYGESFIMLNNDKIIQRIRDAFKEKFFYNKTSLITEINSVKEYPLIQINAALNQLVEDRNEYIVDMYERIGRLINIGELYLFQPIEINDNNITLYERSVPIEYKRHSLIFEPKNVQDKKVVDLDKKHTDKGKRVFDNIIEFYNTSHRRRDVDEEDEKTGDWRIFFSKVNDHLQWDETMINKLLIHHIIESLKFDDTLLLINYLVENNPHNEISAVIKEYFTNIEVVHNKVHGIILQKLGVHNLIIFDDIENSWIVSTPEDTRSLEGKLTELVNKLIQAPKTGSHYIGYMSNFKKDYMIFKIKDVSQKRHTGARCDQSSKTKSVKMLNMLGEDSYDKDTNLSRPELCIIQELLLRKYDMEKKDGERWFLNPGEAAIINSVSN